MGRDATAKATLIIDAKDKASQEVKKTSNSVLSFSNLLKGAAAGAVVAFGAKAVAMASDVEEASSKFSEVFGPAAESTGKTLDEFAEKANRSSFAMREMGADVGALLEPMLGSKDAAAGMSIELVKLATDLGSFNNVAESDALVALRAGLIGSSEPMLRFGVDVRDAAVQAEIFTTGMAKTKSEVTEAMKVQARMNIIMRQTASAQGDAVRTSDSFQNQMKGLEASFEEAAVALGTALIPIIKRVLPLVKTLVVPIEFLAQAITDVDRALSGTVPTIDEAEVGLQRLRDAGAITAAEFELAQARIDDMQAAMAVGAAETEVFAKDMLEMAAAAGDVDAKLKLMGDTIVEIPPTLAQLKEEQKAAERATKEQAAAARELAESLEAARQKAADTAISFNNLAQSLIDATSADLAKVALDNLGTSLEEGKITQGEYQSATRDVMLTFGLATEESLRMADSLGDVNELFEAGKISADEYTDVVGALEETGGNLGQALGSLEIELSGVKKVTDENRLSNLALVQTQQTVSRNTEDVDDNLRRMKDTLIETSIAADAASERTGDLVGPIDAVGGAASIARGDVESFGGAIQRLPTRKDISINLSISETRTVEQRIVEAGALQHGGPVTAGDTFLVGEAGPELFVPSQSGNIVPNHRLGVGGGGGGGQVTIQIVGAGNPDAVAQSVILTMQRRGLIPQTSFR